jgi:outer membrane lipoprotein-sorting protein
LDVANQVIICDNKTIWTYSKEVNEVQINHYNPKEGAIKLDDIFTMYNKGFLFKIAETKKKVKTKLPFLNLPQKIKRRTISKSNLLLTKPTKALPNQRFLIKTEAFTLIP